MLVFACIKERFFFNCFSLFITKLLYGNCIQYFYMHKAQNFIGNRCSCMIKSLFRSNFLRACKCSRTHFSIVHVLAIKQMYLQG